MPYKFRLGLASCSTFLAPCSILLVLCTAFLWQGARAQRKTVAELTLVYDYSAGTADSSGAVSKGDVGASAVHTIYIKGNMSRSEMSNSLFSSTIIFDGNSGFGVILKEVSGQKLLIRMNPDNWAERNRQYDGIVFTNTKETKDIAGYACIKAIGQTRNGTTITVWYTRNLVPETRYYDPIFRTLDGLPLEYELTRGKVRIHYRASSISFNPVPASKFDIPSSGFREMNYEESKKMKVGP
ncbi:MAG TPA: hypothetical protein VGS79_04195 [Puia sp.]|nr:hypothetical protein [Puia sp.]